MKNITNILGILFIILIIIFITTIVIYIINYDPQKQEKIEANNKLSTEQMVSLLKYAQYHLNTSENLVDNSITDEYMIVFAIDYIGVLGDYGTTTYTDDYIVANRASIEQAVKEVFNRTIDYSKVSFEINGDNVFVPIYPVGTDAQIYKFRAREYNEAQDTYTVYIDCLEPGPSKYTELREGNVTEYNEKEVVRTLVFKYKEVEGRRVLLSFNMVSSK